MKTYNIFAAQNVIIGNKTYVAGTVLLTPTGRKKSFKSAEAARGWCRDLLGHQWPKYLLIG